VAGLTGTNVPVPDSNGPCNLVQIFATLQVGTREGTRR